MRPTVKKEDIDKWITIVKIGARLEKEVLKHPEIIKQERVSYEDIKNISMPYRNYRNFLRKQGTHSSHLTILGDYCIEPLKSISTMVKK